MHSRIPSASDNNVDSLPNNRRTFNVSNDDCFHTIHNPYHTLGSIRITYNNVTNVDDKRCFFSARFLSVAHIQWTPRRSTRYDAVNEHNKTVHFISLSVHNNPATNRAIQRRRQTHVRSVESDLFEWQAPTAAGSFNVRQVNSCVAHFNPAAERQQTTTAETGRRQRQTTMTNPKADGFPRRAERLSFRLRISCSVYVAGLTMSSTPLPLSSMNFRSSGKTTNDERTQRLLTRMRIITLGDL